MTTLRQREAGARGSLPVEAAALSPDRLEGLSRAELERLPLGPGRGSLALGDLFEASGEGTGEVMIEGDLSRFSLVGAGMSHGLLTVRGPVGPRAGAGMSGGTLTIEGPAGDYAAQGMTGGLLRIRGDAGDHLAAPLPGSARGMNRGAIVVEGSAGEMAAMRMRRGTIVVTGGVGPGAACGMIAGSLFVLGSLGAGAGALMRRGTIVTLGSFEPLSVFLDEGRRPRPFLQLYYRQMEEAGLALPPRARAGLYRRFVGDISDRGKGEILLLEGAP